MKRQVGDLQAQLDPYFPGQASGGQRWGAAEGHGGAGLQQQRCLLRGATGWVCPPPAVMFHTHMPLPLPLQPGYINYLSEDISTPPFESYYGSNTGWLSHAQLKAANDPQAWLSTNPLR